MHNAPSVVYPVGRCVLHAGLLALMGAGGATVWLLLLLGFRAAQDQPLSWPMSLVAVVSCGAWICAAIMSWVRAPEGTLVWDATLQASEIEGKQGMWLWRNEIHGQGVQLIDMQTVLDLQTRMLLQLRLANASTLWIWAERRLDPARWNDLRRALVSSGA